MGDLETFFFGLCVVDDVDDATDTTGAVVEILELWSNDSDNKTSVDIVTSTSSLEF